VAAHRCDAVFSANTCHIMSWPQVERMFSGIGKIAAVKTVCIYGPFNYGGRHTSQSNARFDAMLRGRDRRAACATSRKLSILEGQPGCGWSRTTPCRRTTASWSSPVPGLNFD